MRPAGVRPPDHSRHSRTGLPAGILRRLSRRVGKQGAVEQDPHHFAINRANGSSHHRFEVAAEIGRHLPDGAEVAITSRDGYIKASGPWPVAPLKAMPSQKNKRPLIKALAAAAVLLLLGGGYSAYSYNQKQKLAAQKQQANEQKLSEDIARTEIEATQLEADVSACGPKCPADLRSRAQAHIAEIEQAQKAQQAVEQKLAQDIAISSVPEWLQEIYISNLEGDLTACGQKCPRQLKELTNAKIEQIKQMAIREEDIKYQNARGNEELLGAYLAHCRICAHTDNATEELTRLGDERKATEARNAQRSQEDTDHQLARGDSDRLRTYINTCHVCVYVAAEREESDRLEKDAERNREEQV
jgi:hypothetical protein